MVVDRSCFVNYKILFLFLDVCFMVESLCVYLGLGGKCDASGGIAMALLVVLLI